MPQPRDATDRWLVAEGQGDEDGAELAFADLCRALPRIEPGPAFVEHTGAALRRRARQQWLVRRAARVAAWGVGLGLSAGVTYLLVVEVGGWLLGRGAVLVSRSLVWMMVSVAEGMDWWSVATRAGAALGDAMATPVSSAVLIGLEVVGVVALVGLQRVLRRERARKGSLEE